MSTITRGLRSKEIRVSSHTTNCEDCEGTGTVVYGNVNTVERGVMGLFDDCGNCDGKGLISHTIKRAIRKRKSKVEVL